ncbi:type I polyketide synthase, partial [Streptomyces sp. NPDC088725]|uniref:type I polyketide synthase n=1 Tax=Streptomyces sp. NPDC088725 TaxID=3365873 RepID=UPI003821E7DF
ESRLEAWSGRISVAAVNGPRSVVVAGEPEPLDELFGQLKAEEVRVRRVPVDYASHSAQVEDLRDELLDVLGPVRPRESEVPFFSTVTGDWLDTREMDAGYWFRNLRQRVQLADAVRDLLAAEHRAFIEVSSHPVLTMSVQDIIDASGEPAVAAGTLRRDQGGLARFLLSAAEVFVRGVDVDWAGVFAGTGARRVDLPTYAFQHERLWAIAPEAELALAADPLDAEFWAAVEQEDLSALSSTLRTDEGSVAAVLPALSSWRKGRKERSTVDSWRYRVSWSPVNKVPQKSLSGVWLLVSAEGTDDGPLVDALSGHGAEVRRLVLDESCGDRAVLAERLSAVGAQDVGIAGVVSVLASAEQPSQECRGLALGLALSVALVQALGDTGIEAPLWFLTRGATSTGRSDEVTSPVQAQVAGVGWTTALEHPQRWGGVIDLPETLDQRAAGRLASALAGALGEEDQLAIRSSGVFTRRIIRAETARPSTSRDWSPRGTTLVTGASGTLAPHLARWLAGQGAEHLVLTSRRGTDAPGSAELVAELAELGTEATIAACDVTDRDAVAALLASLKAEGRTVRTVVHTAALIELYSLAETSLDDFARVMDAKVTGAQVLDELLDSDEQDLILYSSTAGMWGTGQHAAYVAGNAYLAALAANRRARGLRAMSLSWGIWADDMQLGRVDPSMIRRSGLEFMDPQLGLSGLKRALDDDETAIAVADVDWDTYYPVYTSARPTPLFSEVPDVKRLTEAAQQTTGTVAEGELVTKLRALSAAEQARALLEVVRTEAASVLGLSSPEDLTDQRAFRDVGFDSLTAVGLRNRLASVTGLTLPTTMVFDYPNPAALAGFLADELAGAQGAADTRSVTASLSAADDDPIVIIGMSCRYPGGVSSADELWKLALNEVDAISPFPADRGWDAEGLYDPDPDENGKTYSVQGGFLSNVADFDPAFFGISPREALSMDPQQRLLLETAWEAFEHAGIDPVSQRSSLTGTFIGASYQDYASSVSSSEGSEGHMITGTLSSVLSGRVSYLFGFEGPAVTLDTACSSSLVAMHLACQSLRNGESSLALAGGVSIMSTPSAFVGFSRQRALATDGRCKAYAEAADGMTLAEGVGMVLLERLSEARRNGHPVLAVVRGSAVNQDGASNGLTAPNGPSQQRVIRQALANAGLTAAEVDVMEGHGTGTALGDPIEAQALLTTYGQDRDPERPLLLGSVKSNIGHTQMASGAASVIKMVMALQQGIVPKTLHIDEPSSHVDWESGAIGLLTERAAWPETGRPRRGAISSFGLSGTNVHTILEEAPPAEPAEENAPEPRERPGTLPLLVSAKSEAALRAQAGRLLSLIEERPETDLTDLAYSLATTRSSLERRAAVVAGEHDELTRGLLALRDGLPGPGVVQGGTSRGRTAFLFTGQGSQRPGMGQELYAAFPAFADALDAVLARFDGTLDRPLREIMFSEPGSPEAALLDLTGYAQPALFAVEVALFRLAESWGVTPDYLAGHSIGELAAAHVAGVLSLEDACTLVAARGRLMQALPEGGAMISLQAAEDEVLPLLEGVGDRVSIAAVNGPASVVIAGVEEDVLDIAVTLGTDGRKTKRLRVSHAFHSPLMDAMLDDFARVARGVTYSTPVIPFVSNVTGTLATEDQVCSPDYWVQHVRGAVRFADGINWLSAQGGVQTFLELGPDGVLSGMARESLTEKPSSALLPLLRGDRPEVPAVTSALAGAHAHGVDVDWTAFFANTGARRIELPTYAFQRERYWPEAVAQAAEATPAPANAVDAEFWSAVERDDVQALAASLDLDDDTVTAMVPALTAWRRRRGEQSAVDSWRYRVTWKPQTGSASPAALSGRWLVLAPDRTQDTDWAAEVVGALGTETVRVEVTGTDRAALTALLTGSLAGGDAFAGVLSLLPLVEGRDQEHPDVPAALTLTTTAVQALGDAGIGAPLWSVTRGAVSVGRSEQIASLDQAAVWGLGRAVTLEQPGRWGGSVDLPELIDGNAARRLRGVLAGTGGEDAVAVRASGVFVRRLAHSPVGQTPAGKTFDPAGTVLITGGTGGLGGHVARRLAATGADHLLLTSRRGENAPGAAALRAELEELGARVTIAACDVADRDALAALLAAVPEDAPLSAVIHTAGVVEDNVVDALTPDSFTAVLRSKVVSACHLHELTAELDLSAFVLFSSTAGVIGAAGQGNYAAANAYLDALAEYRRAQGLTALSIAWGPWAGSGMVADAAEIASRVRRGGFEPLAPEPAVRAMLQAIEHDDTALALVDMDWDRFLRAFASTRQLPFVSDLPEARQSATAPSGAAAGEPELRRTLAELPEADRSAHVLSLLRAQVAAVLGHTDARAIEDDRAFRDLGFDSLTILELRNGLSALTGLTLPVSLVYDFPTPGEMADFLLAELLGSLPEASAPVVPAGRPLDDDPIAVVGISCRFPGGVTSPEELWQLVVEGRDGITSFPDDRGWDIEGLGAGSSDTLEGGFLSGVADFDARFFGISPREALAMDPQQRLLLEATWEALERAGIDPSGLRGSTTGVFVGTNGQDYATLLRRSASDVRGYAATGNTASIMSGRLSYALGLEGPAVTIDTACSSSLVALHWAGKALSTGECSLVIAGGVSVMSSPDSFVEFSAQGGLAPDGRCKAFADGADGTAWSEGVGILVLERLSDAVRNGHEVRGVIRGTAVNQDGASNGLTAPNGPSQQRVIRQALADAGLSTADIDAVEAHGTGTTLGDPIEAGALLTTYGRDRDPEQPLLLGTVKSNIGHTQAAAGVAGVIKMLMAMRHGTLPKTLHIDAPSAHVDWSSGAVSLLSEAADWPETGRPRRAGVSAFGLSGTNAHVIVEQAPAVEQPAAEPETSTPAVIPAVVPWIVSGRTREALQAQIERLTSFAALNTGLSRLDIGHSLVTDRTLFPHRAVLLADAEGVRETARGVASRTPGRSAFLFSGQGSQRAAMGRELYERHPVFAEALDAVLAHLDTELEFPLRDVLFAEPGTVESELLDETGYTQPALFAVEVALFRLLESWGVVPDYVAGHSIGEVAAAHVAGVFSLEDACRLVAARATLMQSLPQGGAMVAVQATEEEVLPLLDENVSLAAVNGPEAMVVAGAEDAVLKIAERFSADGRRTRRLRVSHAFHSPLMDPMLADFARVAEGLTYQEPGIPVVSNLTGALATAAELASPAYWVRHVREAVRFADGIRTLRDAEVSTFVELGPDGVLSAMTQQSLDGAEPTPVVVPVLRKDQSEETAITTALATLHVHGAGPRWAAFFTGSAAHRVELPTYAFQHERYWPEPAALAEIGAPDPADAEFWSAVEREDLESLAASLGLDGDTVTTMVPALSAWRRRRGERSAGANWHYRESWATLPAPSAAPSGDWLVLVPAGAAEDSWTAAAVAALGTGAVLVEGDPADPDTLTEWLAAARTDGAGYTGVVSLLAATAPGADAPLPQNAAWPDALLSALADAGIDAPLWCVTRGAVSVAAGEPLLNAGQAAVWGAGRVAALEQPDRWGGLVDLPETLDDTTGAAFAALLTGAGDEDQIAVRATGTFGRRLVRTTADPQGDSWQPTGTVLVVGGAGTTGGAAARWLAREGARHVVLTGRHPSDTAGSEALEAELKRLGAGITLADCDVSDPEALTALLAAIPEDAPLSAVIHAEANTEGAGAGTAEVSAALAGVRTLDRVLGDTPLDAFIVFGSIAGVWGVRGQQAEAALGACLDAFARSRRDRGVPALSVAWGAWSDTVERSMAAHLRLNGLPVMDTDAALAALGTAAAGTEPAVTVADVRWETFAPSYTEARPSTLFADLPDARAAVAAAERDREDERAASGTNQQWLLDLPEADRAEALLTLVTDKVAAVLGHADSATVESDLPFRDLGFDSLTAVDLRNQLTTATGVALPATLVFDHPTPAELAAHLRTELLGGLPAVAAPATAAVLAGDDPVVIVGMSCRYPGDVSSPEDLWQLISEGTDAVGDFPTDRGWDIDTLLGGGTEGGRGRSTTGNGGFLYDATDFDPGLFGISPNEAIVMDPQQRILLEAAWEALERSGIDPASLRGSGTTGVFVGGGSGDYRPPAEAGQWQTAQSASLLSGRLAYTFGIQGPTVSVDTACSSSLVALHLAAQALRSGECSIALAGGVTVMATPVGFVEFSAQGALSPDGRCKAFSEDADGTGWSEGVGMLVVERLSDAKRNGHHILAVLRGSAINQDGASNGLTAPSGPAQQRVIRQALANSGLATADVDAVEAHGTGTKLGDPIEAQALLATYGQDRERPVLLGSLKSNIGHTQAASGVGGVIKMIMAMEHGTLPKSLYTENPTSHVDWTAGSARLLTEAVAWPETGRPRRSAVSSFGASGTNAHVILEQAPPAEAASAQPADRSPVRDAGTVPLLLSGRSQNALRAQARRLLSHLDAHPGIALNDLAYSLATTRSAFEHRAAVTLSDQDALRAGLTAVAEGAPAQGTVENHLERTGKSAFLFSGQGSQQLGMGQELYERFPVFAEALDAVLARLDGQLDRPLREVIWGDDADLLNETGYTQPALFAIEVALFRLVESWGLTPDFVAGHSIGEIAAAHVAGVFSLDDAARLVVARAKLMQALPAGGAMVAVQAAEDEVTPLLSGDVSIAAVNGPSAVVVSGAEDAALAVAAKLAAEGRKTTRLAVSHAFHSPLMDPMLDDFRAVVERLSFQAPRIPVVSNLTGERATEQELCSADYWVRHVREAVRFADGVRTMADRGVSTFLELGPDGVLCAMAQQSAPAGAVTVPVLRRNRGEETTLVTALATLHVHGAGPRWSAFFAGTGAQWLDLPTYAFQRGRFWPDAMPGLAPAPAAAPGDVRETDRAFWEAVEQEDFSSLESTLDVEGDTLSKVLPALLDWRRQRADESLVQGWRHRVVWKPLTGASIAHRKPLTGTWLAVVPEGLGTDAWVNAALDALGTQVVRIEANVPDRAALAGLIRTAAQDGTRFAGVVSLLGLRDTLAGSVPEGAVLTTALLQALGDAGVQAPLWCVTRGAVSVNRGESPRSPLQAAVWGMGRVAALEYPERWGGLIDLPETLDERTAAGFAGALAGLDGEDQIAVRASAVLARRLVQAPGKERGRSWAPGGTVLITGGTGALGAHVARRLAKDGVRHLVLLSRRGLEAPGAAELRDELALLGTGVTVAACDVADRAGLTAVLADIPAEHPLTGVVHAAGVLDDGILDRLTPDRFEAVFRSKVTPALLLDELTRDLDLSAFILFSSASSSVGNPGQGNYAAANSVLDALAEQRVARGVPATSVAWGAWGGGGMAEGEGADEAARRAGVGAMDPQLACEALLRLVMEPEPTAVVAEVALEQFVGAFGAARPSALLREFPGYQEMVAATAAAPESAAADSGLRDQLMNRPAGRRLEVVVDLVRTTAARVLGYPDTDAVGAERSFRDLGVDSLGAVELRNQLNKATGLSLSATLVFDHPTPAVLGEHVLERLIPDEGPAADGEEAEIRALLAAVPLAQLREMGVLEPLLQLAGRGEAASAQDEESDESIDSMAVADLVRAALNGQSEE